MQGKKSAVRISRFCRAVTIIFAGCLLLAGWHGAKAQALKTYKPDFDCSQAAPGDSIAALLCHDSNAAQQELVFDQTYYALRQQVGKEGWKPLKQEVNEQFQGLLACVQTDNQQVPPPADSACYISKMQAITAAYRQRLHGTALKEASRPIDEHIALQQKLIDLGYLPTTSSADGVYGEATRTAIETWQRVVQHVDPDGFISDASADTLLGLSTPGVTEPVDQRNNDLEQQIATASPVIQALIREEDTQQDKCKGGSGDDPATQRSCDRRDHLWNQIEHLGWCYGPEDEIEANKHWMACPTPTTVAQPGKELQQASTQVAPTVSPSIEAAKSSSDTYLTAGIAFIAMAIIVGLLVYLVPTFIAFKRGHAYRWVILAINVFGAWTGLGWLAIMIWAVWPSEQSAIDPIISNVTGIGSRNTGDTLGSVHYSKERGYRHEVDRMVSSDSPLTERQLSQLARLGNLKEQGILTEAEFAAEKTRVLQTGN
jgi:hypothetical protein